MSTVEIGEIKTIIEGGNITVTPHFYNASDIATKYIEFTFVPYDANNNVVANKYSGEKEFCLEMTTGIPPKWKTFFTVKKLWLSNVPVTKILLSKIRAVYIDNSVIVIDGKDVVSMNDKQSAYYNDFGRIEEEKRAAKEREEAEKKQREEALRAEWQKQNAERMAQIQEKVLEQTMQKMERNKQKRKKRAENLKKRAENRKKIKKIFKFWERG